MNDNNNKSFMDTIKSAGVWLIWLVVFIALFGPGLWYVINLFQYEEKRKPKPGEAVSLLLFIALIVVFTIMLYPLSLWLYGFAIVCWIGVNLFFKFIKFLWGNPENDDEDIQ